jgi:hypothetical protein
VGDQVRTHPSKGLGIDVLPFCGELMQDLGHVHDVMKDDQVADEMIVLDDLALLIASILGNDPLPTKEQPLEKAVQCFALVHRAQDRAAQVRIGQVLQQEPGAHDTAQLPHGEIQAILTTIRPESSQDG